MIAQFAKRHLLLSACALLLSATIANANIYVHRLAEGGIATPHFIEELNTTVGSVFDESAPEYWKINSSNTDIKFIRHIISDQLCEYWFREDNGPDGRVFEGIEYHSDVYWYAECLFVDGAQNGSNNFVLLHSAVTNELVAVLQYALNGNTDIDQPARLLAYAVGFDNFTYESAIDALSQIPEPSTLAFISVAAIAGMLVLRRRR